MNNMIKQFVYFLMTGMVVLLISCHGNRLKTDEKKLAEEILLQDKDKAEAERITRENQVADTLNKLPVGFRFNEDRSVDPDNMPMIIDIAGSLDNIKDFSLSDVASKITYIRMQEVPDTNFSRAMKFKYYLMDNNIVAVNPSGILFYTREGKFVTTIVKNETTGIMVEADMMTVRNDNTFIGGGTSVWAAGNSLFYKYRNTITGQSYIMEYDCSQIPINLTSQYDPEKPEQIKGLGEVVVDLNHGKNMPSSSGASNGMWSAGSEFLYKRIGTFLLDHNTYAGPLGNDFMVGGKYMLGIFNKQGDTLATFTQFEKLTSFSKSVMRGTDGGTQYENRGNLFFRNAFNDTIFQVVPPNRLLPVYVMKLGKYKLLKKEGMDPDFDLTGKIIPETWADGRNFIFLTFSKDSYDCPNTRKSKQLKLYYALFSKSSRTLNVVKGDPQNYSQEILINNLDGGLPVWPSSYMIGNNGEILISLKGSELKEHVKSEQFIRSAAPEAKKNELKNLAQAVSDSEDILMIIE
jgi:hypothetical protein